jgi:hypothetical protein
MSSFNSFQLFNDFIILNNITCFQHNTNTIKRKHVISIERTRIYSMPWLVTGLILCIYGIMINISLSIIGLCIVTYQVISIFMVVILVRVPGYTYSNSCCACADYDILINWFHNQPMQFVNQPILTQISS